MKKTKVKFLGRMSDGRIAAARRDEDGNETYGAFREAESGTTMRPGEEYLAVDRPDADGWRDAQTLSGPAQVATKKYRDGYDRIFGGKTTVGEA